MKAQWLDLLSGNLPCSLTSIHWCSYTLKVQNASIKDKLKTVVTYLASFSLFFMMKVHGFGSDHISHMIVCLA